MRIVWSRACAVLLVLVPQDKPDPAAPEHARNEPRVPLRFEGWLPGSCDPRLEGRFRVDFAIYRAPQGGEAVWRESHEVLVERGHMDLQLGLVQPIPMELHQETFKFLGAAVNGAREVYPRFTVVNVVFAAPEEALLPSGEDESLAYLRPKQALGTTTESPATWREALQRARAAGGDLPDYEDWYRSLMALHDASALERAGHYEWVLPWVYDPASHARYHALFRGRFQGCDYMDLSPSKHYGYRIALPTKQSGTGRGSEW